MPLLLPHHLPAIERLRHEGIFVEEEWCVPKQTSRPLRVAVLNLMPIKEETETDLVRLLAHSPLTVELTFVKLSTHTPRHTSAAHMEAFYNDFASVSSQQWDGMIVTGAPVEQMDFETVDYWQELQTIMDWTRTNVRSTLFICWGAQAALYHFYGIPKYPLTEKKFGIFTQQNLHPELPIFRGFDDEFMMPHSRHTEIRLTDVNQIADLCLLAQGEATGASVLMAREGREFFVTGHMEYAPHTLDQEYKRDQGKRNDVSLPQHYYPNNNPTLTPKATWRAHANLFFTNWLHYYVCPSDVIHHTSVNPQTPTAL